MAEPARPAPQPAEHPDGAELAQSRVFLRPIANPFPLGFLGLAGDTLVVAGTELGWIPHAEYHHAAMIVLVFAPLLQTIACVFGFLGRDPVAATGMGVLAGTWALIGLVLLTSRPGSTSPALGTFLFLAATAVFMSAVTAAHTKLVPALVMGLTGLRFLATGLFDLLGWAPVKTAAGIVGCLLAAAAVYAAVSLELEGARHHPVLPTLRRRAGARALEPVLGQQVRQVAAEPGVRNEL